MMCDKLSSVKAMHNMSKTHSMYGLSKIAVTHYQQVYMAFGETLSIVIVDLKCCRTKPREVISRGMQARAAVYWAAAIPSAAHMR